MEKRNVTSEDRPQTRLSKDAEAFNATLDEAFKAAVKTVKPNVEKKKESAV